jgi:succinate dehydrogenase/fumarate reductase cytochrome b subunit
MSPQVFPGPEAGYTGAMTPSSIVVIIIGIVLALLVNYILGIVVILIGLAMLLMPMLGGARRRV